MLRTAAILLFLAAASAGTPIPSGSFAGAVECLDGSPVEGAVISAWRHGLPQWGALHAQTDAEGRFELHGLTVGGYAVVAEAEGFRSAHTVVEIRENETAAMTLTLEGRGRPPSRRPPPPPAPAP